MSADHEYSVIGHSRAVVGRYLGTVAAALAAAGAVAAAAFLRWFDTLHTSVTVPDVVLWPVTAAAVFAVVLTAFDKLVWRWPLVRRFIGIPDLNGVWTVDGVTTGGAETPLGTGWTGEITISQSWERIWVHLRTPNSSSRSKAAALMREPGVGHCLMYSYRNEPRMGEPMQAHVGYAELVFDESLSSADGEYFNSKGRVSFGRMNLKRKS